MKEFNEKRHKKVWHNTYRGIAWEINLIDMDYDTKATSFSLGPWWTYYVSLIEDNVPQDRIKDFFLGAEDNSDSEFSYLRNRVTYDYYGSLWNDLPWHGEITYFELKGGLNGDKLIAKAGCDYNHSFDQGHRYTFNSVASEVRETIDALIEMIPGLKTRCGYCGKFSEGENDKGEHGNKCVECAEVPDESK